MKITTLGIDLAKDVFKLHGVNEHRIKILGKKVTRSALPAFIASLPRNISERTTLLFDK